MINKYVKNNIFHKTKNKLFGCKIGSALEIEEETLVNALVSLWETEGR